MTMEGSQGRHTKCNMFLVKVAFSLSLLRTFVIVQQIPISGRFRKGKGGY